MHVDVTSDNVKVKMADLKVKLYIIIAAYNISGNGNGNSNLVDEEDEWVPLASTDQNYGHWDRNMFHRKKNKSCVTQANTVYLAKAKFILARIGHSQFNTVYCVNM